MVSTRRSRSGAVSDSEQQYDEAGPSSQEDAASQPTPSKVRASRSRGTHANLQPIEEEPAAALAAVAEHAQQEPEHQLQQPPQGLHHHHHQKQQQQEQQEQQGHQDVVLCPKAKRQPRSVSQPTSAPPPPPPAAAAAADAAAEAVAGLNRAASDAGDAQHDGDCHHNGGADDDDDWDFDGPDMLQHLAASLRSAMNSRAGVHQHQHRRDSSALAATPAGARLHAAAVAADADGDDDNNDNEADLDVNGLQWRPSTGLQLPEKAACIAAVRTGRHDASSSDPVRSGPLVQLPSSAESGIANAQPPAAAAAAATAAAVGAAGLAKHARAPTLDPVAAAKQARKAAPKTAGKGWFELPEGKIDDSMKRDLRLLRLRGAYDPKRFYKSFDETKFPKHFAVGTVVDDPLDFYGGRLTQGQRKASMTDQLLADRELEVSRKKRFSKLQDEAQKWVKHKKRKTGLPRKTPAKHRPKH